VIEACEATAEAPADMVDETGRAVVSDDGREIRLTVYSEAGCVAAVALDPVRAVGLAAKLIEAAVPRLRV
jgi:hypothetical protein